MAPYPWHDCATRTSRGSPATWASRAALAEGTEAAMPIASAQLEELIKDSFPDAEIRIEDLAGDGDHYRATIVAEAFRGKSRIQQHQLVYRALGGRMGGELHALALVTRAPG